MSSNILELFTISTSHSFDTDWNSIVEDQYCRYLKRKCIKTRKSQPDLAIGSCSITHAIKHPQRIIICPHRFLERGQIFLDCLHLLTLHEPGYEIHLISEVEIPGGSVDYFLVSVNQKRIIDFVGIEIQALDTTGTLWSSRQRFLETTGIAVDNYNDAGTYGINWKMTAKTTLVQLHHKVETFEGLGKHLVLVIQDQLMNYMMREFNFEETRSARLGDTMHFHAYELSPEGMDYRIKLASRLSTDSGGVASSLGLRKNPNVQLETLTNLLQSKLSRETLIIF